MKRLRTWYRLASGKADYYYYEKKSDNIQASYDEHIAEIIPIAKKEVLRRYGLNLEVKGTGKVLDGTDFADNLTTYVIVLGRKK